MSFIKQVALPTPLRLDALMSHHDSLAGGGHLRIDKVKSSLIQKYYWPKMPPMTNTPLVTKFDRWHVDILGPITKTNESFQYVLLCVDGHTR